MKNKILVSLIGALLAFSSFLMGHLGASPAHPLGSVAQGSEYHATSTALNTIPNYTVLSSGQGALGSVNITNATGASANGKFCLYDATSTQTNGLWATTTIACFATNVAVGSYHFDAIFQKGLLLEEDGAMGSTTITFR